MLNHKYNNEYLYRPESYKEDVKTASEVEEGTISEKLHVPNDFVNQKLNHILSLSLSHINRPTRRALFQYSFSCRVRLGFQHKMALIQWSIVRSIVLYDD